MDQVPYYIVFAGIDGAGKSTLHRTGLWQQGGFGTALPHIAPDEVSHERPAGRGSRLSRSSPGRLAAERSRNLMKVRASFCQETTLAEPLFVHNLARARALGYRILLYYVGIADPSAAEKRAGRMLRPGDQVAADAAEERFGASLRNLSAAIGLCDEVYIYDNTEQLRLEARFAGGQLRYRSTDDSPAWLDRLETAVSQEGVALP